MKTLSVCIRSTATLVLMAACLFLCLGFWFTTSEWDPAIFGRYSVKWFAGSLAANAVIILCTWSCVRAVRPAQGPPRADRPDMNTVKRLSTGKRLLFGAIVVIPALVALEAGLGYLGVAPLPPEPMSIAGTEQHFHALLQHVDRIEQNGKLVRAYRGKAYDQVKTTEFRVVCLGGSTTWGHRLPQEDTWPAILEEMLRRDGYDIEIINAARPYYTTAHSLGNYCLQMRHYDPDVVVIMHGMNDLERSFPQPGEPGVEWDYGSYQGPMRRVLETYQQKQRPGPWHPLDMLNRSVIYRLICEQTALDRKFYGDLRREAEGDHTSGIDVGLDAFPTIAIFRSNLEYLARLCLDDGRLVLLSTQPHVYERTDLDALDNVVEVTRKEFLIDRDRQPISRRGVRLGMRGIRDATLDVAKRFNMALADPERAVNAQLEYFMDDLHLNAGGNTVAAEAIAEALRPILDLLREGEKVSG